MQRVLVVDDIAINRKLLNGLLGKMALDIAVYEAGDGEIALKMMTELEYALVILDIMMPNMDGIEVLRQMRLNPVLADVPVIICSAHNELDSVERALEMGAIEYFFKPFTSEQMRVTLPLKIKNALAFQAQKRELANYLTIIHEDLALAERLQKSLIPNSTVVGNTLVYGSYMPCQQVGGDLYAFKKQDKTLWFIMADSAGHGIAAAMSAMMIKVLFNTLCEVCTTPGDLMTRINGMLCETFGQSDTPYVSAVVGHVQGNKLRLANAGHPYPLYYSAQSAQYQEIDASGFLLGMFDKVHYDVVECDWEPGDGLLLHTDGLYDLGKSNSEDLLIMALKDIAVLSHPSTEKLKALIDYFHGNGELGFDDDVAVLCLSNHLE